MIVLIDTSTPVTHLTFREGEWRYDTSWEAGRGLSKGLLRFLDQELSSQEKSWQDVTALGIFKGPGSFTGLRIGITVFNTLAYARTLPIAGATGAAWQDNAVRRLEAGENDEIVLPEYGGEAHITQPRK